MEILIETLWKYCAIRICEHYRSLDSVRDLEAQFLRVFGETVPPGHEQNPNSYFVSQFNYYNSKKSLFCFAKQNTNTNGIYYNNKSSIKS